MNAFALLLNLCVYVSVYGERGHMLELGGVAMDTVRFGSKGKKPNRLFKTKTKPNQTVYGRAGDPRELLIVTPH